MLTTLGKICIEVLGLQTPRGRIIFFVCFTLVVLILPLKMFGGLSLWGALGIPAPSIGLTRAYWHVVHGDLSAAKQQNQLIFLVLVVGLPIILSDIWKIFRKDNQDSAMYLDE